MDKGERIEGCRGLSWMDFCEEFEIRYYLRQYRRKKELEFLALRLENITVLEYKRRFQDLSIFAPVMVQREQHRIDRLRDGFRQELRKGLVTFQPRTVRELIEVAWSLETILGEPQEMFGQDKGDTKKRKEVATEFGKPPLPNRGGHGRLFLGQSQSFKRESNASTGGSFGKFS